MFIGVECRPGLAPHLSCSGIPEGVNVIGRTISHYKILAKLGEGGMGVVYKAKDTKLKRTVALKFLQPLVFDDEEGRARFLQEAQAAAALDEPNIGTIYEIDEAGGQTFISMAYVEGMSVKKKVQSGPLDIVEALDIAIQTANGLRAAHEKGILHRDIKSANIMVTAGGQAKIMDFGLAKLAGRTKITKIGMSMGTIEYMSPEQARGTEVDHRSDIWSLGVVLYEMVTGQVPFKSDYEQAVIYHILNEVPEPVRTLRPDVPAELEQLIEKAMTKVPERRYSTAEELIEDLTDVKEIIAASPKSALTGTRKEPSPSRKRIGVYAVAAILVLLLAGYVFFDRIIGPPALQDSATDGIPKGGRASIPASASEAPVPENSIAVLPFTNMSADEGQEYFCDGIAEDIINDLTQVDGLYVVARTSAFALKGRTDDIREIGRKLNASAILEGSVRKEGNNLRITAQLINVEDGYHIWSERYDRELKDVFEIQEEIAQNIVHALKVELSEREKRSLEKTATLDIEAYDLYLRGREFFHQHRRGHEEAIEMFSKAIEQDPDFALAYAAMANCYTDLYVTQDKNMAHMERCIAASQKALELNPDLAEAHVARGFAISLLSRQYEEAEKEFEIGIQLNSRLFEAYYLYARSCRVQGKMEKAARLFEQSCQLRPDDYQAPLFLADTYADLNLLEKSKATHRKGLELVTRHLELYPNDARALYLGGNTLIKLGQREKGLEWASRSISIEPDNPLLLYNIACIYSTAGEAETAIDYLERAIESGYTNPAWAKTDSDLDPLRSHPRFQALMERLD
jgi:serine/threonine protein kinase/Tfp pilus assembly protein PilF